MNCLIPFLSGKWDENILNIPGPDLITKATSTDRQFCNFSMLDTFGR
jgi:hypothetical protein